MAIRITITSAPARKKPRVGDKKLIKGVMHVRRPKMAYFGDQCVGFDCTGGRQRYEWVPVDKAVNDVDAA